MDARLPACVLGMALLAAAGMAAAGPRVIEETARIGTPDPTYWWPAAVAIDGDWLIASGVRIVAGEDSIEREDNSTWLYRRQNDGSWQLVRRLHQQIVEFDGDEPPITVAMQDGVAVILKEGASWVFERVGDDWVQSSATLSTDGMDVEVNDGTIVVTAGYCDWIANAYRKAADGTWQLVRSTPAESVECENEDDRGDTDVSGTAIIVGTYGGWGPGPYVESARIFAGPFWQQPSMTRLLSPEGLSGFAHHVAIDGDSALASGSIAAGIFSYARNPFGWSVTGTLRRPDQLALGVPGNVEARGGLAVAGYLSDPVRGESSGSVAVFRRNAQDTYDYVARLVASDAQAQFWLGRIVDISGRRIATTAGGAVYVFELPEDLSQPATVVDSFEDGDARDWSQLAGSSFAVATTPATRVFRQSSVAGDAAAFLNGTHWTNQSVEAEITPTAYASGSGSRWFGLAVRYTPGNFYYVTLRRTNVVELKKMLNGTFSTLASAPLPVTLNRKYRVRLEAIGTRVRVYVDGELLAEAQDDSVSQGQAGVSMYRTQADYDNVIVTSGPRTVLASYDWEGQNSIENWDKLGAWTFKTESPGSQNRVYEQGSVTGDARAIGGIETDDQIVEARMKRITTFGTNNWMGLATRYRDSGNYYYVTLRNNNVISLRKIANGAFVELDSAALTATTNTWYNVRFSAVGDHLSVYLNDQLLLEATDSSHAAGRYGPVMYRTAAQYDDIIAIQP